MTEIKVCGIKKEDDLLELIDLNVTWAGFVFYKDSIRNVDYNHDSLFEIARNKIGIVCLFVNPRNEFISKIVQKVKPDLIQLHGSETPSRCNEIKKMFEVEMSEKYNIHRTRQNFPNAIDNFTNMANIGVFITDRVIQNELGGGVDLKKDLWYIPVN